MKRATALTTLICLILCASSGTAADAKKTTQKPIVVIAHRGAHEEFPENTLESFRRAIELGVDYVEVDVRPTRDGRLILMHDSTVDRMTDGHGKVDQMTFDAIRKLHVKPNNKDGKGEFRVPTFDEALETCRGKIKVYVDHKSGPPADVFAAIKKHGMVANVVIYGGVEQLREFKKLDPSVWIMPDHPGSPDKIHKLVADLKPETLDGNLRNWTKEQVEASHQAGAQVWVDNLGPNDDDRGFQKALDFGVDAIQTDHPAALVKYLKKVGRK